MPGDDDISFSLNPAEVTAASLQHLLRIDAKLTALLMIESAILAHLTGTDEKTIATRYANFADSFFREFAINLAERHEKLAQSDPGAREDRDEP